MVLPKCTYILEISAEERGKLARNLNSKLFAHFTYIVAFA